VFDARGVIMLLGSPVLVARVSVWLCAVVCYLVSLLLWVCCWGSAVFVTRWGFVVSTCCVSWVCVILSGLLRCCVGCLVEVVVADGLSCFLVGWLCGLSLAGVGGFAWYWLAGCGLAGCGLAGCGGWLVVGWLVGC